MVNTCAASIPAEFNSKVGRTSIWELKESERPENHPSNTAYHRENRYDKHQERKLWARACRAGGIRLQREIEGRSSQWVIEENEENEKTNIIQIVKVSWIIGVRQKFVNAPEAVEAGLQQQCLKSNVQRPRIWKHL